MKKILFALLALTLVFVSCKKENGNGSSITDLQIKPASAVIAEGGQITLTPITQPAGVKGSFTWSSSDTTIAVVDQEGNVTGYSAGVAYITCEEKGGLKAQSEIKVTSYLESFSWGQAMVYGFSSADTVGAPIVEVEARNGGKYNCYFIPTDFMVFSEGFYISDEGYYTGAEEACVITMPAHILYGAKNINPGASGGTIFCLGAWQIVKDSSNVYDRVGEPGEYTDSVRINVLEAISAYNDEAYTDFATYMKAAGAAVKGTILENWNYSCDEDDPTQCGYSYSYVPDAIVEEAYFYLEGNDGSSGYMINIDYGKFAFRQLNTGWWGLDCTYDDENSKIIVNDGSKLQISDPITVEWGTKPASAAARSQYIELPESILYNQKVQATVKELIDNGKLKVKMIQK